MDSESTYSALIWQAGIMNAEGERVIEFYFDDASGKMISFFWYFPEMKEELEKQSAEKNVDSDIGVISQIQTSYDTWGNVDMLLDNGISDFFRDYYDLEGQFIWKKSGYLSGIYFHRGKIWGNNDSRLDLSGVILF